MLEKELKEIELTQNEDNPSLDKKCIGLYNTMVITLEEGKKINLTESYFKEKNSCFDPSFAGCYITPGKITTLRKIHINALESQIRNILVQDFFKGRTIDKELEPLYEKYLPELLNTYYNKLL